MKMMKRASLKKLPFKEREFFLVDVNGLEPLTLRTSSESSTS